MPANESERELGLCAPGVHSHGVYAAWISIRSLRPTQFVIAYMCPCGSYVANLGGDATRFAGRVIAEYCLHAARGVSDGVHQHQVMVCCATPTKLRMISLQSGDSPRPHPQVYTGSGDSFWSHLPAML